MKITYTPRQIATNRQLAGERTLASGRTPIMPSMNGKLNVILDTCILISKLIAEAGNHTNSAPFQIIEELKKGSYNLIQPSGLFEEYKHELDRLAPNKKWTRSNINLLLNLIQSKGVAGRAFVVPHIAPNDQDDRAVFNTSFIGNVDYVVTTDTNLITGQIPNLPINIKVVRPRAFLKKLHMNATNLNLKSVV